MKNLITIILIFGALLLIIPAVALYKKPPTSNKDNSSTKAGETTFADPESYKMLDTATNDIVKISPRDYIIGAIFAEMPANFESESLKAQAVIAHTYILRQYIQEKDKPTENLKGADFSNDTSLYNAYFSKEQAKSLYGQNYEVNLVKISTAVDAVINKVISYNNELILPAFHSMSGGMTESAKVAWGTDFPYLQAVSSTGEQSAKGFSEEKKFTPDELSTKLTQGLKELKLEDSKADWIKVIDKSPSGTVLSVKVGNLTLKGNELRDILSLRSSYFDVAFESDSFKITTKGVGHGVGLSQYGANSMALNGDTFEKIISYYYNGVKIQENK